MFLVFLLLVICILRVWLNRNSDFSFDAYGHLYFSEAMRVQKKGPFEGFETKIVNGEKFRNVVLWNWVYAKFPQFLAVGTSKYINNILDIVFAMLFIPLSLYLGVDLDSAMLVSLLYLSSPMWFSGFAMGPRVLSFTPRLPSEILVNAFFIITVLQNSLSTWLSISIGGIVASFALLSSKFSTQALLFVTPVVAVLIGSYQIIVSLIVGFLLSFIITKGQYVYSLKSQLVHLNWYFWKNIKGEVYTASRNNFNKLASCWNPKKGLVPNVFASALPYLRDNSITAVIFKLPVLVFYSVMVFACLIVDASYINQTVVLVVFSSFIVYAVTSFKLFAFLGEAERYLNHVAFFIVFGAVVLADSLELTVVLVFLASYGVLYAVFELVNFYKIIHVNRDEKDEVEIVFDYLKKLKEQSTVLLYPYHAVGGVWKVMLHTQHKVVYPYTLSKSYAETFDKHFSKEYPYANLDSLELMHQELGADILILQNKAEPVWNKPQEWRLEDLNLNRHKVYVRDLPKHY